VAEDRQKVATFLGAALIGDFKIDRRSLSSRIFTILFS
jgi:hypothetical protein